MNNRSIKIVLFFLLVTALSNCFGQISLPSVIEIRIYSSIKIKSLEATVLSGEYLLTDASGDISIISNGFENIEFFPAGNNNINVLIKGKLLELHSPVNLSGRGFENFILLQPSAAASFSRAYDDDLIIHAAEGELTVINRVALEKYIAGVVQAESGWFRHEEFYKVQATVARTYALRQLSRHQASGFHLCDQVHCQVFYGRCNYPEIIRGVWLSAADVIVDENNKLIESVYHANCGGQTVSSGDIWPQSVPYLTSVIDPWCADMPGSTWQASVSRDLFLDYLLNNHSLRLHHGQQLLSFSQKNRMRFLDSDELINLRFIRSHFNLRSTFFSFYEQDGQLLFKGRGYGHGVGLCQEGAMKMAENGYQADSIIKFYYRGVRISNLHHF
jgi:stage II sporulation protein D